MLKIEGTLCPVDFSEPSRVAYEYAQSFAQHYDSKLYLEHVIEPLASLYPYYAFPEVLSEVRAGLGSEVKQQLEKFVSQHTHNGKQPDVVVREGTVTEGILGFADQKAVNLIVMGTHGRRGMDHVLLGSVTEKVLRKSRCPVLAVRKPVHGLLGTSEHEDPVKLRGIIFCTDFSEPSAQALKFALSLAMEFGAELTLVHVLAGVPEGSELGEIMEKATRRMQEQIPPDAQNWCTLKTVVRVGKPYQEIIQLAFEARADLIVMGVRGRNAVDLAVFGSTTHRVIQLGSCPVLAVHTAQPR